MASYLKIILCLILQCFCDLAVAQNIAARDCPKDSRSNSIGPCAKSKPNKKTKPSTKRKPTLGPTKDRPKPPPPDKTKTPEGSQLPEIEGDKF